MKLPEANGPVARFSYVDYGCIECTCTGYVPVMREWYASLDPVRNGPVVPLNEEAAAITAEFALRTNGA